jgi:NAD(P)-dependent dehydrogenase (short-subunit alcohol dehydrogenase family)
VPQLKASIESALAAYRTQYSEYYHARAQPDSPALRDTNPTIVLIPGLGMFSFGKTKTEARITGEFYSNAIHVMEGASLLADEAVEVKSEVLPQCGEGMDPAGFKVFTNYVAMPLDEAFRIEYWAMEEAKIRRQPAEKELSRFIVLVVGGASGIGREVALLAAARGAQVMVADGDSDGAASVAQELARVSSKESVATTAVDIRSCEAINAALTATVAAFGGIDILINTTAMLPSPPDGAMSEAMWAATCDANVTANYLLCDEAAEVFAAQGIAGSIVLASLANAVGSRGGGERYDVSQAALSDLVRELAVGFTPRVRVNGIAPAMVVKGSTTLTHRPIDPAGCAEAILFLASPRSRCTTGHLIPVDGGLPEAFLR